MLKQVSSARFEREVTRFVPLKIQKCLENGPLWDHEWVKNWSKMCFSKSDPRPFGMLKQVVLTRFEPVVRRFGPWKIPKCPRNGWFWDQKWVKNGSKMHFSKIDLGPFGMLKQVSSARFEPEVTHFVPWKIPKCFENGPLWDHEWVKNWTKMCFSKSDPRPFGMLKQVVLTRFEPVVRRFGPWKIPKCPRNGWFWDQKWVKNGSKMNFSKIDPRPFGMLKQVVLARCEPLVRRFGPWKIPKCPRNGPLWDQKWVKNWSKTRFSKSDPRPFGMLKQVVLARFEPVVTRFGPWKIPKCPRNGPFWDQKWVKNGSKMHFSKIDLGPFGMLKQVSSARFEREVTRFVPWKIEKCFENALKMGRRGTMNASKMSQKCVFPKVILGHWGCSNKWF